MMQLSMSFSFNDGFEKINHEFLLKFFTQVSRGELFLEERFTGPTNSFIEVPTKSQ